ncbi:FAD-dependent oxidoreductase [Chondrinema litorale]|uniref:FAD-dependent oxidoreductase n=1 Tax=Chondrinema litorale TaxID=2994555 RepID=UPI002543F6D9|nr:FAD-dependent oxidoreductase [Chondrinema litorale]UZR98322.1 FAD-dependent oxidoreductase [Chondrinema litorale]
MKKLIAGIILLPFLLLSCNTSKSPSSTNNDISADIIIYGATSAGVIAAYSAKQMGKSVLIIEPSTHLGGLSSGGLGQTDIGNKYAVTGLARDFYRRIGKHYGQFEKWLFEPHVARETFQQYIDEADLQILYLHRLVDITTQDGTIQNLTIERSDQPGKENEKTVSGKMFIDCTYEGDLMAKAGVSYIVGREANKTYNETINGVQLMEGHQFPDGVDPYKTPGDPSSGLIWGVSDNSLLPNGTGDSKVQAYNYRICLTKDPENSIPITKPEGYDASKYELLLRLMAAQPDRQTLYNYFIWSGMPNSKTDINNRGGFSTDMIGMNYDYPEASYEERAEIVKAHDSYTKGLLYFVGNDSRVPEQIRTEMQKWGYPKDEYPNNNHWTPQLYVREARRMIGSYVMTQANCLGEKVVDDKVGMAAYTMDSHNCQRIVVNGQVKNEGNVEVGGFGPFPIAYRSLTPKETECKNLLVPVCLSASHIAYGSIRMEPVFMVLGQSAAVAASMAIDAETSVQNINVDQLKNKLASDPLLDGNTAEIVVDNEDNTHLEINGNWENRNRGGYGPSLLALNADENTQGTVKFSPEILKDGLYEVYAYFPKLPDVSSQTKFIIHDAKSTREVIIKQEDIKVEGQTSGEWASLGSYQLPAGKESYVEISTEDADGLVFADAIIWIPAKTLN